MAKGTILLGRRESVRKNSSREGISWRLEGDWGEEDETKRTGEKRENN